MERYHDTEWGTPQWNDKKLFEALLLDSFQAGLSWAIILAKREGFKHAFDNYNAKKIAQYGRGEKKELLNNTAIIRNRLKIEAAIANAKVFLAIQKEYGSFAAYIWKFAKNTPIQNKWRKFQNIPAQTELSQKISKDMKERGFKFVGPTTIYAFMQGVGMVNDHLVSCFRHKELTETENKV